MIGAIGLGGLAICLLLVWALSKLSREILERESFAFDTSFLLWFHQLANPTLDNLMVPITQLGNPVFVIPVATLTLGILVGSRRKSAALMFAIACLGGVILNTGLKLVFTKPRPELWHRLIVETSYSYPSGHALGSMVLYGMIAYLLSQRYPKESRKNNLSKFFREISLLRGFCTLKSMSYKSETPKFSSIIYVAAAGLILTICFSRLYLGVHWPTDIMAGLGIGLLWLIVCITMLKLQSLRRKSQMRINSR